MVALALTAVISCVFGGGDVAAIIVRSHPYRHTTTAEQFGELVRLTGQTSGDARQENRQQERRHYGEAAQAGESERGTGHPEQPSEQACCYTISPLHGGHVHAHGDHRIAMASAIAGQIASKPVTIDDCDNVATSFPGFVELATSIGFDLAARRDA